MSTKVPLSTAVEMQPSKPGYVTISVDDGYPEDLTAAAMFQKYGLQATFYVPARNPERAVMTAGQIRELAREFEIGSHTYNHAPLKYLSEDQAWAEIRDGKQWLEDTQGASAISFCYPRGKFNRRTVFAVRKAGFLGARTSLHNLFGFPSDPFRWGISTQAHRHSRTIHIRHALLERNLIGLRNLFLIHKCAPDWEEHFLLGLEYVKQHGGIAHLCLHSWEMEEPGEWQKLDSVLKAISRSGLRSMTNGALFRMWGQEMKKPVASAGLAGQDTEPVLCEMTISEEPSVQARK